MIVEFLTPKDLTAEDRDILRDQGVSMDDWDWLLLVPPDQVSEVGWADGYRCNSHDLDVMLSSHYARESEWYRVNFRGKEQGLGVRYH